jgi:hypothetical protein
MKSAHSSTYSNLALLYEISQTSPKLIKLCREATWTRSKTWFHLIQSCFYLLLREKFH